MKRLIPILLTVCATFFLYLEMNALPVAIKPIQEQENGIENIKKPSNKEKGLTIKEFSKNHQNRLKKKVRKLEGKLKKRGIKKGDYGSFGDVFGERYFILGAIFILIGIGLAISGAITSIGLFGWFGGLAVLVGLILVIIAIIQAT